MKIFFQKENPTASPEASEKPAKSLDAIRTDFEKNFRENPDIVWEVIKKNLPKPQTKAEK